MNGLNASGERVRFPSISERLTAAEKDADRIEEEFKRFVEWATASISILAYSLGVEIPTPPGGRMDSERLYLEHNLADEAVAELPARYLDPPAERTTMGPRRSLP